MHTVLIGCDPEFAMYDKHTGEGVSSIGVIPGSKEAPVPVEGSKVGLKIQPDNVTVEMNITPTRVGEFATAARIGFKELRAEVKRLTASCIELFAGDSYEYSAHLLQVPEALRLGCNPDQLAHHRGEARMALRAEAFGNRRMLAGHIHIGYDKNAVEIPDWAIVQGAEALSYLPAFLDRGYDTQDYRRKFYGIPGLYRSKSYGFEYRTPCSKWMDAPILVDSFAEVVEIIINSPLKFRELWGRMNFQEIQEVISTNGKSSKTRALIHELRSMKEELMEAYCG